MILIGKALNKISRKYYALNKRRVVMKSQKDKKNTHEASW